jgi:predicted PP-loop superfamily ATPase
MRIICGRCFTRLVNVALALTFFAIVPAKAISEESLQARNDAYLNEVISILRSHVLAMRMIIDHDDLRYADNMVRHAEAFERAFGMIGPMEWHAAEAFNFAQKSGATEKLSQAQFEELAEQSNAAIRKIKRSATRYVRDKNKDLMRGSINEMIKSCGSCHARLPQGSVPGVWKGIKE